MLGINSDLSESFLTSEENLKLMARAADGDGKAIDELRKAASKDIALSVGVDDETASKIQNKISDLFLYFCLFLAQLPASWRRAPPPCSLVLEKPRSRPSLPLPIFYSVCLLYNNIENLSTSLLSPFFFSHLNLATISFHSDCYNKHPICL